MSMETAEDRLLMLETVGVPYMLGLEPLTLIPGKSKHLMADYHSPYNAEVQTYVFVTTEDEATRVGLTQSSIVIGVESGRQFTVVSVSPDETFWVVIEATWDSDNVVPMD